VTLTCGLIQQHPGWQTLLEQAGIFYRPVHPDFPMTIDSYAVVIVNAEPTSFQQRDILQFLKDGGAVLATHGHGQSWLGSSPAKKSFSSIMPDAARLFVPQEILDIHTKGVLDERPRSASIEHIGEGYSILHVGRGTVVTTPFDINELICSRTSRRKNFYFETERLPSENVSSVSKGSIRRFITSIIEYLYMRRDLPFIQKWYYPDAAPSIFTFRIDSDQGTREQIRSLYDACDRFEIPATWFLDTHSHEAWLDFFRNFRRQEIGVHCYQHLVSDTEEENLVNFSRAVSLLQKAGIRPTGAAAPFGKWNESIQLTFENIGAAFSSEFSLDYDDLPFYPRVKERFSTIPQLPIHPVCMGSMLGARFSASDMAHYFLRVAEEKIADGEPVCFYHHPTHRHFEVLHTVFQFIRERNIPVLSYSEYASWWRERLSFSATADYQRENGTILLTGSASPRISWRIVLPNGSTAIIPHREAIDCAQLPMPARRIPRPIPPDIRRVRTADPRHVLLFLLNTWYRWTQ
jgi:hypothetical protein